MSGERKHSNLFLCKRINFCSWWSFWSGRSTGGVYLSIRRHFFILITILRSGSALNHHHCCCCCCERQRVRNVLCSSFVVHQLGTSDRSTNKDPFSGIEQINTYRSSTINLLANRHQRRKPRVYYNCKSTSFLAQLPSNNNCGGGARRWKLSPSLTSGQWHTFISPLTICWISVIICLSVCFLYRYAVVNKLLRIIPLEGISINWSKCEYNNKCTQLNTWEVQAMQFALEITSQSRVLQCRREHPRTRSVICKL